MKVHTLLVSRRLLDRGCFYDLGLLFHSEILPCQIAVNVVLIELQNLVMTYCTRICKVHDAGQFSFSLQQSVIMM